MNKEQFEERIMALSKKDKDGFTWVETNNVLSIFGKFLNELNIEILSSIFVELKPLSDKKTISEEGVDEIEELIAKRIFHRIYQGKDYCPICKGECKNHGRKNYIYETEE